MFRILSIVFTLTAIVGCGGNDSSPVAGATELEGTWYGEERDTNVPTVVVMKGNTFTYNSDPQYYNESYSGTFSISGTGNPSKLTFHVTQASEPLAVGQSSYCLYNIDTAQDNLELACNGPGNPNYPAAFTATNETRVWDFSSLSSTVPVPVPGLNLTGTWSSNCISDSTQSIVDVIDFTSNGNATRTFNIYNNTACSGTATVNYFDGTYSLGAGVTSDGGFAAYQLDAFMDSANGITLPPDQQFDVYTIAHIDNTGRLFLGESVDQPGGSSTPSTRPNALDFTTPYQRQ